LESPIEPANRHETHRQRLSSAAGVNRTLMSLKPRARTAVATAGKEIAYRTGLHHFLFYRYDFMFRPHQLAFLVSGLTGTHGLPGPIIEIGCAHGHTTVFLNKHLDDLSDTRTYICIDTFAGFTPEDIAAEVDRGKDPGLYAFLFRAYRKRWFDRTLANNDINRVVSIEADVNAFDFGPLHDISFCLIDVDLKRPVVRSLEQILPRLAPGGMVVVDDCAPRDKFDGALAGYLEFVEKSGYPVDIREGKLGIIALAPSPDGQSAPASSGSAQRGSPGP
jgi:O-methyltransferase